jgi:hypothetical protein
MVLGYDLKMENLFLGSGIAYNRYYYEDGAFDEWINCYLIYLKGKAALGMVDLQWNLHYGQNLGDFGLWNRENAAYAQVDAVGNDIENSKCYGGYLQVAIPVDPVKIRVGYGYVRSQNDETIVYDPATLQFVRNDEVDAQRSFFVNAKLPIADTFFVVPEYSYYDQMDNAAGVEEDDAWYAGLMWRMDF